MSPARILPQQLLLRLNVLIVGQGCFLPEKNPERIESFLAAMACVPVPTQIADIGVQLFEQLEAEDFIEEKTLHQALARLLWGAFLEAGVYISHATEAVGAQHEMLQGLQYWLGKLRIKH